MTDNESQSNEEVRAHMPETPRISVHDYIDARLDEQDERIEDELTLFKLKTTIELRELRGWFLMLSAPGWADYIKRFTNNDEAAALAFVFILIGLLIIVFYRTRQPKLKEAD